MFISKFLFYLKLGLYAIYSFQTHPNLFMIGEDNMISEIKNEYLNVVVNTSGAELNSIKDTKDNTEYLWQADENVWKRHAPVLFPIVGRLNDNKCTIDGKEYSMTQHGFARDMKFKLDLASNDKVVYSLTESNETLKKYPYRFLLTISYTLKNNKINVEYSVKNTDDKEIWFSIGAHPAFTCPIEDGTSYDDYYLKFDREHDAPANFIKDTMISNNADLVPDNSDTIPLSKDLFKYDALVFKNIKCHRVSILSKKTNKKVSVRFYGLPYLGIWSKTTDDAKFVCIEPWHGTADSSDSDGDFKKKDCIISLKPGREYKCGYTIEISK